MKLLDTLLNLLAEFSQSMFPLCQTQPVRLPLEARAARPVRRLSPHHADDPQPVPH